MWKSVFDEYGKVVLSCAELKAVGATEAGLTAAVRGKHLIRARRDHYVLPDTDLDIVHAVRVGGRIGCVSALAKANVFVHEPTTETHIHLHHTMSRTRSAQSRGTPLARRREGIQLHWRALIDEPSATSHSVGLLDALAQSVRCQHPWLALAAIDNALHLGLVLEPEIDRLFDSLSSRHQYLRALVDGRAESGQETILRMIIRQLRLPFEAQVDVLGVGRVDFVVANCLVVEADSRLAHDGWELHVIDRKRDLLLASDGYMSLRPAYQHTMHEPELVARAILRLVRARRPPRG